MGKWTDQFHYRIYSTEKYHCGRYKAGFVMKRLKISNNVNLCTLNKRQTYLFVNINRAITKCD